MKLVETKQLFTELTTEESAAVNGGDGFWMPYLAFDNYYGYYTDYYWYEFQPIVPTQFLPPYY